MKRPVKVLALILMIFFTASALGQVQYSIDAGTENVEVNSTVLLQCDSTSQNCPVNNWRLQEWRLPEDTEILGVEDSIGEINDYTVNNRRLSFQTNTGDRRTSERVKIRYRIDREAEEVYRGLKKRQFSLPGFQGRESFGKIEMDDLISGRTGYGFETAYGKDHFNFSGTGPVNIRLKAGQGNKTDYYDFFGKTPQEDQSLAYEIPVAMTGQVQNFERFPVAVINPEGFDDYSGNWVAGEYIGGSIKLRENLGDSFTPVLAHETVHGLNDRKLNWDQTSSSYMDEGTAKYVEHLVKMQMQGRDRVPQLFGEEVSYMKHKDGKRYRVTLPSQGDRDKLWSYYRNDEDFMKNWNPLDFSNERGFGYAYSELIIRNHVVHENGSLQDVYRTEPGETVNTNTEKWSIYSNNFDLKPCNYSQRTRFDNCLDEINSYNYSIYRATDIDREGNTIKIEDIQIPENTVERPADRYIERRGLYDFLSDILQFFRELFN